MRQTACARRVPSWYDRRRHPGREPHDRHEAAGIRQPARRRGGAWPFAARAQQAERVRRIGVFTTWPRTIRKLRARLAAFPQGLQQLGWIVGRTCGSIIAGVAAIDADRMRKYAAELVALAPDVILAAPHRVAPLLQATRTVPIVFAGVARPGRCGLCREPGTAGRQHHGFIQFEYGISAKWLELLKEIAPA